MGQLEHSTHYVRGSCRPDGGAPGQLGGIRRAMESGPVEPAHHQGMRWVEGTDVAIRPGTLGCHFEVTEDFGWNSRATTQLPASLAHETPLLDLLAQRYVQGKRSCFLAHIH